MKYVDTTHFISSAICNSDKHFKIIEHLPGASVGDYKEIGEYAGKKDFPWFFGLIHNIEPVYNVVVEVINEKVVRISNMKYFERIFEIISKFEEQTGQEILLEKVKDCLYFSAY